MFAFVFVLFFHRETSFYILQGIYWGCVFIFFYPYKDFVLSVRGADSNTSIEETEVQRGSVVCPGHAGSEWLSWVLNSSWLSLTVKTEGGFPPLENCIAWPLSISCLYWFIIKAKFEFTSNHLLPLNVSQPGLSHWACVLGLTPAWVGRPRTHLSRMPDANASCTESDAKPIRARREFRVLLL